MTRKTSPAPARIPQEARIDWRPVLNPRGPWSALVTPGSGPERVAKHAAGLVYVSAPYLEKVQIRGAWRFEKSVGCSTEASRERLRLAACGVTTVCPAVDMAEMAHARAALHREDEAPDPLDAAYWRAWSNPLLSAARLIAVPAIPGWDSCALVWRDLRFALTYNLPVHVYGGLE